MVKISGNFQFDFLQKSDYLKIFWGNFAFSINVRLDNRIYVYITRDSSRTGVPAGRKAGL